MNYVTNQPINYLTKIKDFALDLIFPKNCVGCGKEGEWICQTCQKKIVLVKTPTCPTCQKITNNGQFCPKCRVKTNLTGVIVAAYYEEGPLKEAIHTFKYEGVFDLSDDLSKILLAGFNHIVSKKFNQKHTIIIPVPLHKKRRAQRGFNQAELLARQIITKRQKNIKTEEQINLDRENWQMVNNKLIRHKYQKKSQVELSGKARRINLQNSFSWVGDKNELSGKVVLLVDDVYTTGSTLNECAKILRREAGVRQVWGLVLAKA